MGRDGTGRDGIGTGFSKWDGIVPTLTAAAAAAATSTFAAIVIIANIINQNFTIFFGRQEPPLLVLILGIYDKFWSLILARLWKNLSIILQTNFSNVFYGLFDI